MPPKKNKTERRRRNRRSADPYSEFIKLDDVSSDVFVWKEKSDDGSDESYDPINDPHMTKKKPKKRKRKRLSPFSELLKASESASKMFEETYDPRTDPFSEININKEMGGSGQTNKEIIDRVFAQFGDDPHAKLPFPETPRYANRDNGLMDDLFTTPTEVYVPYEVQARNDKALVEGQKDFCRVLLKKGINPAVHFASVFRSKKKTTQNPNFGSSTPVNSSSTPACEETPLHHYSNNGTPSTGFELDTNDFVDEDVDLSDYFPFTLSDLVETSLNDEPDDNLPPEVQATLLSGVVCYVDVKDDSKNATKRDHDEMKKTLTETLLRYGARVEKNFTKKVTHVMFKKGRISTYLKAKKEGIPLVGILWLKRCRIARGIADPLKSPPKGIDWYENLPAEKIIKKRRIAILNPNSRVRQNLLLFEQEKMSRTLDSSHEKGSPQEPVPETKKKRKMSGKTVCGKKLLFEKCEEDENNFVNTNAAKFTSTDISSTDNSSEIEPNAARRRKSVSGKLPSKRNSRCKLTANEECDQKFDLENNNIQALEPDTKFKKLLDPKEEFNCQLTDTILAMEVDDVPIKVQDENVPPPRKRRRTKALKKPMKN